MDFCNLLSDLDKFHAKFLSVKEQFDTSTPAGEMMIYNMINLAQFERKQTSERVALSCHSRALRGLLNGGSAILGYDKHSVNKGTYVVNEAEAEQVRTIFRIFLETGSRAKTCMRLHAMGIGPKVNPNRKSVQRHIEEKRWTPQTIGSLLKNPAYAGLHEVNKESKGKDEAHLKHWQKNQLVKASWPAIIGMDTFESAQLVLAEAQKFQRARLEGAERRVFLLSGLLRCSECGRALIGQSAHGSSSVHRYYSHKYVQGEVVKCAVKSFRADEAEEAVISHLTTVLKEAGYMDKIEENLRASVHTNGDALKAETSRIAKRLLAIEKEISGVFDLQTEMSQGSQAMSLVHERLNNLGKERSELENYREDLKLQIHNAESIREQRKELEERVFEFTRGFQKATPNLKKRLLRRTIQALVHTPEGFHVLYLLGKESSGERSSENKKGTLDSSPLAPQKSNVIPFEKSYQPPSAASRAGSLIGCCGAPGRTRTGTPV
mgnify:CR=1 FL=1